MRLLRNSQRSHKINQENSLSVNCDEGIHNFLPVHISQSSESNIENNLDASDRVENITQHALSNISCKSTDKLGFDDNDQNLTVNNSGENPCVT